jgi:hypothetical protein
MILAGIFAALTIVTVIWPMWIENLTGLEPDQGSSQLERLIVALLAALAVLTVFVSRRDFRRARSISTT